MFDTISDFAANAGIIVGPVARGSARSTCAGRARFSTKNGVVEETGLAAGVLGHPPSAWRGSPTKIAPMAKRLNAGDVVLAGFVHAPGKCCRGDSFHRRLRPRSAVFRFQIRMNPFQGGPHMIPTSNPFKGSHQGRQAADRLQLMLASPLRATGSARGCGFDWVLIDGEHCPNDVPLMAASLQVSRAMDYRRWRGADWRLDADQAVPRYRRANHSGADGWIMPPSRRPDMVRAMRYPPRHPAASVPAPPVRRAGAPSRFM